MYDKGIPAMKIFHCSEFIVLLPSKIISQKHPHIRRYYNKIMLFSLIYMYNRLILRIFDVTSEQQQNEISHIVDTLTMYKY